MIRCPTCPLFAYCEIFVRNSTYLQQSTKLTQQLPSCFIKNIFFSCLFSFKKTACKTIVKLECEGHKCCFDVNEFKIPKYRFQADAIRVNVLIFLGLNAIRGHFNVVTLLPTNKIMLSCDCNLKYPMLSYGIGVDQRYLFSISLTVSVNLSGIWAKFSNFCHQRTECLLL